MWLAIVFNWFWFRGWYAFDIDNYKDTSFPSRASRTPFNCVNIWWRSYVCVCVRSIKSVCSNLINDIKYRFHTKLLLFDTCAEVHPRKQICNLAAYDVDGLPRDSMSYRSGLLGKLRIWDAVGKLRCWNLRYIHFCVCVYNLSEDIWI